MKTIKTISTKGLAELPGVAKQVFGTFQHKVILFIGDLGAGKTTLIKELLHLLGSDDSGSSPSYSIINQYKTLEGRCFHMDLYRLNTVEEAFALGLEEVLYRGDYCFVEWPQLVLEYLEPPYHVLEIELKDDGSRNIHISEVSN